MKLRPPVAGQSQPLATCGDGAHLRWVGYEDAVLRQVMTAVIDLLGAIPPVRYVMGLVDARWRPLWAALWLTVIASILFLTIRRLAFRRARSGTLQQNETPDGSGVASGSSAEHELGNRELEENPRVLKPASTPPRSPTETTPAAPAKPGGGGIPVPVVLAALAAGALAVALTALLLLPNKRGAPANAASPRGDSAAAADTGLDVRWRSGRMDGVDCLGTFEVKRGSSTSAQFVAFVMDTSGAIMARDSVQVKSAVVPGLLVDFRFRRVACTRIYDWQLQVTTPKTRTR